MKTRRKPSFTADAACAARANGARHADARLRNPDSLAGRIVGMPFRMMLWPPFRGRFELEYDRRAPGVYYHHQARTHAFDAVWRDEMAAGTAQYVLLGAGFDTRAYRFADALEGARVFEVDHPLTSAEKQTRLRRVVKSVPAHVTYVPVDFVRESVVDRLAASGFDPTRRTLFLWEGVTPYLTDEAVNATLAFVGSTAKGSSIGFDYMYRSALVTPTPDVKKQLDLAVSVGEPYQFGVDAADLAPLLARHGLALESNLDADAMVSRYLIGSDGKAWGRPCPILAIAHARA
jgi:methyltransferase (TIGR00027 family)